MKVKSCIIVMTAMALVATSQPLDDLELARMLSDGRTREAAVAKIVATGVTKVPVLLSWTRVPPTGVDRIELYVGVAEAFGALKAKEAVPFLITNISIQPWLSSPSVWLKTSDVVVDRLPAVRALIQIGPEAAKALMGAAWDRMGYEDRLASLIVVSRVGEGPESREFITRALGEANLQRDWAQQALTILDLRTPPAK
jgi:hypothetical protein